MTRWLWVWFLAILAFPIVRPHAGMLPNRSHAKRLATARLADTPSWGGPLAPLVDRLAWVGTRRLTSADLCGHPAIVEFWTFACVNCRRTLPAMRALEQRYRGTEVRVLSIHTPELDIERDPTNVASAVARERIEYPVALDPDERVWDAFGNRYWPCVYLLDRTGAVRFTHIGELHEGTPAWRDLLARVDAMRGVRG